LSVIAAMSPIAGVSHVQTIATTLTKIGVAECYTRPFVVLKLFSPKRHYFTLSACEYSVGEAIKTSNLFSIKYHTFSHFLFLILPKKIYNFIRFSSYLINEYIGLSI
jgi:hypothetical protein